jgi:hypothetical protein
MTTRRIPRMPYKPAEPSDTIRGGREHIGSKYGDNCEPIDIPAGATSFIIENAYDGEFEVTFYKLKPSAPNPNYSIEHAAYVLKLAKYEEDLKKYNKYQEDLAEEKKARLRERELKQYEKLKKKYG